MRIACAVVAVSAVIACATPAWAQDEDSDLARTLTQRGWFDLAEEVCNGILKSARSADARSSVPLIISEIRLAQASTETDLAKQEQMVDDAVNILQKFVKENAAHKLALDARISIGWAMARKAKLITEALDVEADNAKHAELKKKAATVYGEAEKFYRETLATLQAQKQTEEVENATMDARLELPRTLYERSKQADDEDKKKILKEAGKLLTDFEFDYGDRPIAFEAMLLGGQCMLEAGDWKQAEVKLRGTIALKHRLAEAKIRPNDYHNRIIYDGYIAMTQMYTRSGRASDAKNFVDQVFKENKGIEKEWAGLALKLEKADAHLLARESGAANSLYNEVQKADPEGRYGAIARKKLSSGGAASGGSAVLAMSPDQAMSAAEGYLSKEQWKEAAGALRRCIEGCTAEADRTKYIAQAYNRLGQCMQSMKRNYEAALAFEIVCRLAPKDPLAGESCYEVLRCYNSEFAVSGEKRDEDAKQRAMQHLGSVHKDHPAAINIPYILAEEVEAKGDLRAAADKYLTVTEKAPAYEQALVRAGHCYRVDSFLKWSKGNKDDALKADMKLALKKAEDAFQKFLGRPVPSGLTPDQLKARNNLIFLANDGLARIYMHEAIGRAADCLTFLEKVAKDIPADDARLGKNWALQIQAMITLGKLDPAMALLERMFEKFPDGAAIAQAAKSVAIKLDEQTQELIKAKAEQAKINANLKKISRYYAKWLNEGPAGGLRITMDDVLAVADTLYIIAKQLNQLDDTTISFLDLKGKKVGERQYWSDAAFVHTLLVDGKVGKLSDKQKITLMTRLARCYSFTADNAEDWAKAKEQYENIVKAYKLVDDSSALNVPVLQKNPSLLGVYLELGYVFYEMGRKGQKFYFDSASTVFGNLLRVAKADSEPWWLAKYMGISILYERGKDSDIKLAKIAIENLEKNNPEFDGGKHGMKDRFLELRKKIDEVTGGR